jgi:3-oxoacyl-[acyl-carrier protein] reductase
MGLSSIAQKVELRKLSEGEMFERDFSSRQLGRLGRPDAITHDITFLVTEDGSWITGQALVVDGGTSLSPSSHRR